MSLHRHQLLRLSAGGWSHALREDRDDEARGCLALWAGRDLPLVVTRQAESVDGRIRVGLPAPAAFGRRRLALAVDASHVESVDTFPAADRVTPLLPASLRAPWHALLAALAPAGCDARVYGGHGWQALTGLAYLHEGSDLDLLLPVSSAAQADAVCAALVASTIGQPRLDGELLFPDGDAIAWREWHRYRLGYVDRVLVKRLREVTLLPSIAAATRAASC